MSTELLTLLWLTEQGHHHNADQVTQRPHMMCSICGRRFATRKFGGHTGSGMG